MIGQRQGAYTAATQPCGQAMTRSRVCSFWVNVAASSACREVAQACQRDMAVRAPTRYDGSSADEK